MEDHFLFNSRSNMRNMPEYSADVFPSSVVHLWQINHIMLYTKGVLFFLNAAIRISKSGFNQFVSFS